MTKWRVFADEMILWWNTNPQLYMAIEGYQMKWCKFWITRVFPLKVVVKPSGEMWMACMGVSFHVKSDIQSIVGAALRLLRDVQRNDAILVEAFYPTLGPCRSDEGLHVRPPWACARSNACRFRATVCRGSDDKAHMTKASHLNYYNDDDGDDNGDCDYADDDTKIQDSEIFIENHLYIYYIIFTWQNKSASAGTLYNVTSVI